MKLPGILVAVLFLAGCNRMIPTPDDFPSPPMTVIVELPVVTPTATRAPRLKPVSNADMAEAENLLYLLKTMIAAGDSGGVAEKVNYPLEVTVNGERLTIRDAGEFERNYDRLVNQTVIQAVAEAQPEDLVLSAGGVRVGEGAVWFGQYCSDELCSAGEFKVSAINP